MELRRYLNFVWRSIGPQGALLYTALLIIRRVESSNDSTTPLYHLSIDFMKKFAEANGPKVSLNRLNSSCKPFYPLPPSSSQIAEFLDPKFIAPQFRNSTDRALLLLSLWSRLHKRKLYKNWISDLCPFIFDVDPRLSVCQIVARRSSDVSSPRKSLNALSTSDCVQRTFSRRNVTSVQKSPCSEDDVKHFNSILRDMSQAKSAKASKLRFSNSVIWGKVPVFFCSSDPESRKWLVVQYLPIYIISGSGKRLIIGVLRLMYPVWDVRIDQCRVGKRCSHFSTYCKYRLQDGKPPFSLGNYFCECKQRFYRSDSRLNGFNGSEIEAAVRNGSYSLYEWATDGEPVQPMEKSSHVCSPCHLNCEWCNEDGVCEVNIDYKLRDLPLGVQSFCITVCLVVMVIVFKIRRKRVIKTSGWALIEIFIFGAVLLYSTVVVRYFEPTQITCLLLPWLREVGFSITYGTLIVKVYRVLSGFQSRKAHRVCVRDKDVLRYILGIFIAVIAYMGACTAVNMDHLRSNPESRMVVIGNTTELLQFKVCRVGIWSGVAEASEFLFLCWGLYYCHCVRSAPSEYSELRFITVSLIMETIVSLVLHISVHFIGTTLNPDYVYFMYFARCHLTVTITVILIIGPKLWYLHRPPAAQFGRSRALSHAESHLVQPIKLNLTSNGDIDLGEINIADMDPEDIRRELKRLYTQMEIYKTKEMRKDNPHVSKRRGGRKQTHRRFSLQPFHHKHRSHQTSASVHEEEVSKVSDGSNNSGDEGAVSGERKTTS